MFCVYKRRPSANKMQSFESPVLRGRCRPPPCPPPSNKIRFDMGGCDLRSPCRTAAVRRPQVPRYLRQWEVEGANSNAADRFEIDPPRFHSG